MTFSAYGKRPIYKAYPNSLVTILVNGNLQRLILFLNEFLGQHELVVGEENLYQELLAAVRPNAPLIVQLVNNLGITMPGNLQAILTGSHE